MSVWEVNFVLFNSILKYVINRLMHAFFHIRTVIIPRPISTLGLKPSGRYQSLGMIAVLIWKGNALIYNCCLIWSNHLEILANKISKKLGVLKRLKPFMSGDDLLKVYNCIIFPHFNYCCTVWSGAKNSSNIDRLLKLQTRAARIILNVSEITTPSFILFQN